MAGAGPVGPGAWRRAACVAVAALVAGCGGGGNEGGGGAGAGDALPGDLEVHMVVAGENGGWIDGVTGDEDTRRVWRITPDGDTALVGELPPDMATRASGAIGDQLAVAGLRCLEGEFDEYSSSCGASRAEVLLFDEGGRTASSTLYDFTGLDGDDRLSVAGSTSEGVWVATEEGLFAVSDEGEVVRELPDSHVPNACVIDGSLYRLDGTWVEAGPAPGGSPPTTVATPGTVDDDRFSLAVTRLEGDGFSSVPGGVLELDDDVSDRCTGTAWEIPDHANRVVLARWTPAGGWEIPPPVPAPAAVAEVDSTEAFALTPDGTVLERGPDGAFGPTGIRIPELSDPELEPVLHADRSSSTVVACVSAWAPAPDTETVCRAAPAG